MLLTIFIIHAACIFPLLGRLNRRLEALREYTEQQEYEKMVAVLADEFGENDFMKLMDEGRIWTEDLAVAEALLV